MSSVVQVEIKDKVTQIQINNGKVNAISHEVIDELNVALDEAEKAQTVVVLTGTPGMLSGGYDLGVMRESMSSAMALVEKGSRLSRRLLSFPYPVIAACPGHAVAKGAFLLLSVDYRIGVEGKFKIGLNEVAIGMSMHHAGLEIARGRLAPVYFNRAVALAEMVSPTDAVKVGFLDMVVSEDAFSTTVAHVAQAMTKLDMHAHKVTKLRARSELLTRLDECIEIDAKSDLEGLPIG